MTKIGRDENSILLERIAVAVERLAEDPVVEMEVGPPVCPYCQKFNPRVATQDAGGVGHILEVFLGMVCQECDQQFYAVPMQWSMQKTATTLRQAMEERAAYVDHDNGRRR
jgi:hypothetical protein